MTSQANAKLPVTIRQHLTKKSIVHAVGPNKPTLARAEVALLSDDHGLVQVFTSSDRIIEIDRIRALTGRPLVPLTLDALSKIKRKLNIQTLPAFDDLIHADTIIDQSLYESNRVLVCSGDSGYLLALKHGSDMRRKEDTLIADITSPIPIIDDDQDHNPLEGDHIKINNAVSKFTALRIHQRLDETLEIPPLPDTAQAIIRLRVDPNANIEKLSHIVERDPSLAAQVVSWASSSYYSAPGSIKSVQDAIVRVLGYDLVMNLALGLSLGKSLDLPANPDKGAVSYWNKSVYVAACVGALVSTIPREFRPGFGLCYLSGLLHNFGYLILAHSFKPHFATTNLMIDLNRHIEHQHIEQHVLGITRDQIAASLMSAWNLPNEVVMGIRNQSNPMYFDEFSDQANLIYLANHLLQQYGLLPTKNNKFNAGVYENLRVERESVAPIMEQLRDNKQELDTIASTLGV